VPPRLWQLADGQASASPSGSPGCVARQNCIDRRGADRPPGANAIPIVYPGRQFPSRTALAEYLAPLSGKPLATVIGRGAADLLLRRRSQPGYLAYCVDMAHRVSLDGTPDRELIGVDRATQRNGWMRSGPQSSGTRSSAREAPSR
jgi:hypothetical protein